MKKFLVIAAVLIAIIVIAVLLVFQMTSGIVDVVDDFFADINAGNIENAYRQYLSEDFRASTSLPELKEFLEQTALQEYAGASWSSRSINGDQGELEGSIETAAGGTVPITIDLVKENGGWKIHSIYKPEAGLVEENSSLEIPSDTNLKKMADASLNDLALAINSGNFGNFHKNISEFWRTQVSEAELMAGFESFIEQQIDLTALEGMEPVFSETPHLNEHDALILKGYFPSQPSMTYFDLSYIYEHPDWKLVGIAVDLK